VFQLKSHAWFKTVADPGKNLTDPSDRCLRWSIVLITVLALTLRLIQLGTESICFDEEFSIRMAMVPLGELLPKIRHEDFNPPLYYLILHGWMRWFGDSEWILRLFSALCGILSIPVAYRLGKDLLGKTVSLWATFLMAISVYHIYFSQQIRGYTLFALLTWISMILFFRLLESPSYQIVLGYCGVTLLALPSLRRDSCSGPKCPVWASYLPEIGDPETMEPVAGNARDSRYRL
jgi:predicted membrane-bound mannosyltransferase